MIVNANQVHDDNEFDLFLLYAFLCLNATSFIAEENMDLSQLQEQHCIFYSCYEVACGEALVSSCVLIYL